ncbi:hypothetical protein GSF67_24300 (plasmid) [Agrobacterium sp. CGMCC 11546]|nr:hypothetical protein GSF67_24300 [Agrobacterium sp. CGMCC 11546]
MIMASQNHDDRWWADIVQTEIRLPQKGLYRICVFPPSGKERIAARSAVLKKIANALYSKIRALFASQQAVASHVSDADLAELYVHACLASPLFCYVPPGIYGLADSDASDKQCTTRNRARPGDHI